MKIIEISEDWKEPTFEEVTVKCTSCGSKLSIEAEDITVGYNNRSLGSAKNRLYFVCPVCFAVQCEYMLCVCVTGLAQGHPARV